MGHKVFSIGLTGGIGSGKSQVADWLEQWGAAIVDTDSIAHALTAPGGAALAAVQKAFGAQAIGPDGGMDRQWVRDRVFADIHARRRLEAIVHPLIARQALQTPVDNAPYRVFVVPLLAESDWWQSRVDRICVVDCDPATQLRRVHQRSGLTYDTIKRIMSAQADRHERLAIADDVILNDGSTSLSSLQARAHQLHKAWRRLSAQAS